MEMYYISGFIALLTVFSFCIVIRKNEQIFEKCDDLHKKHDRLLAILSEWQKKNV